MSSIFGNWFSGNKEAPPEGSPEAPAEGEAAPAPSEGAFPLTAVKAPPTGELLALPKQRYGIDDAIKLMRTLPIDENVDLVVRVIKNTLQSLDVRLPEIIEDAGRRQEALSNAITEHETSILKLEREIETRRNEIAHLQDELAETSTVRERLELAEQLPFTPPMPRVTTSVVPGGKMSAAPNRSAPPPVPPSRGDTSFRPKTAANEIKKSMPATPPAEAKAAHDEELPVESQDFVEKST